MATAPLSLVGCYGSDGNLCGTGGTCSSCSDPDCTQGDCIDATTVTAIGLTTATMPNNPVALTAAHPAVSGGTSIGAGILSFFSSVAPAAIAAGTGTQAASNLRLQINPATGQQQYYNPATGQYIGSPVGSSSNSLFGGIGGSSVLLVIFALVIAWFAFGGRKALASA
jgi:hypothetical protein